jgi:AcrR family transcriptional regulator
LTLLSSEASFAAKLDAMTHFACEEPQMEAGCLFVKMRSARSCFGKQTQTKIAEIEGHTLRLFARFFREGQAGGEWPGGIAAELAATYLQEQLGLAFTQRAAGKSSESVRELLTLSLSVLQRV